MRCYQQKKVVKLELKKEKFSNVEGKNKKKGKFTLKSREHKTGKEVKTGNLACSRALKQ